MDRGVRAIEEAEHGDYANREEAQTMTYCVEQTSVLRKYLRLEHHCRWGAVLLMAWRLLLVLFKSVAMVALFKFLSPVADAIGLQLDFIATVSKAISNATAIPVREAEILFLLALAATLLEIGRVVWDLITG